MPFLDDPVVDPAGCRTQPEISRRGLTLRRWTAGLSTLVAAFRDEAIRKWSLRSLDTTAEAAAQITAGSRAGSGTYRRAGRSSPRPNRPGSWDRSVSGRSTRTTGWRKSPTGSCHITAGRGSRPGRQTSWPSGRWTAGAGRLELVHSVYNPESCGVAKAAGSRRRGSSAACSGTPTAGMTCVLHSRISSIPTSPPRPIRCDCASPLASIAPPGRRHGGRPRPRAGRRPAR